VKAVIKVVMIRSNSTHGSDLTSKKGKTSKLCLWKNYDNIPCPLS